MDHITFVEPIYSFCLIFKGPIRLQKLKCVPELCVCASCRVLLSIMYLMVETIRVQTEDDRPEWIAAREAFKNELGVYLCQKRRYSSIYQIQKH